MKLRLLLIQIGLALGITFAHAQGTFVFDQQSSTNETPFGGNVTIQTAFPIGQSFLPSLTSVEFIRLQFADNNPGNSLGATVIVNLRTNSISGTILGSTAPVSMPDAFSGITNFFFSSPLPLTPDSNYFFDVVVQSGDQWNLNAGPYSYSRGAEYYQGIALSGGDLWFREGILAVPEPASVWLLLFGGGVLLLLRRKRRV